MSLVDKDADRELVAADACSDPNAPPGRFGQLLCTIADGGTGIESNALARRRARVRLAAEIVAERISRADTVLEEAITVDGAAEWGRVRCRIAVSKADKLVELTYSIEKPATDELSALYVAFPLDVREARLYSDSQAGWVDWQRDALPGACHEWYPLQTSAALEEPAGYTVHLSSPDVPLFCNNGIVRGAWPDAPEPPNGRLYSYVMNNHWRTNYVGRAGASVTVRYRLRTSPAFSRAPAFRDGWGDRLPLQTFRSSYQAFRPEQSGPADPNVELMEIDNPDVVLRAALVESEADGPDASRYADGVTAGASSGAGGEVVLLLRFAEVSGAMQTARVRIPTTVFLAVERCDHTGRPLRPRGSGRPVRPSQPNDSSPEEPTGAETVAVAVLLADGSMEIRVAPFEVVTYRVTVT